MEGIVTEKDEDSLVVSLGGIGLKVFVTREAARKAELHKSIGYIQIFGSEDRFRCTALRVNERDVCALCLFRYWARTALEQFRQLHWIDKKGSD